MMFRSLAIALIFVGCCTLISTAGHANKLSYGINGGVAIPNGDGSEYWNTGFNINAGAFYILNPYFSIGARAAYNRWTPDESAVLRDYQFSNLQIEAKVDGELQIFEFSPSIQLYPFRNEEQRARPYIHGGAGVYHSKGDVTIEGTYMITGSPTPVRETASDEQTKFGTSMGAGSLFAITEKISIEVLALFHIIFTEDETTRYFALSAGVWF